MFVITTDNSLCVADDENLSVTERICQLDPNRERLITGVNDLAYNHAVGRLCVQYYSELNREARPCLAAINMDDGGLQHICELPVDVNTMAIDVAGGSRTCYELGTFADGVWPVAGLMESGELRNHIGIITGAQGIQVLSQPRPVEQPTQTKGGLHSAAVPMSFPEVGTDRVQVDVTLPTAGTNADMTVFFDSTATAPPSQRPPAPRAASPPTPASAATATSLMRPPLWVTTMWTASAPAAVTSRRLQL